jgi:glycosyltransferase involved in cell wall biosynthesis
MKIAFDLRRIGNPGIGRYMRCLVEGILEQDADHDYLLLLGCDAPDIAGSLSQNVSRLRLSSPYYSVREQFELPRVLRQHKVDLLHSPHFLLPLSRSCPAVATIHDVIYLACREDLASPVGRLYYKAMMHASARRASRILTDSVFSKNEIVRFLGIDAGKISLVYPSVAREFTRIIDPEILVGVLSKFGIDIDEDYVFYAGIYKSRKNHAGLLRAFKLFLDAGAIAQLIVAGPIEEGKRKLQKLAEELEIAERVIFTGRIDDFELRALYSAARLYACPSLYEGFGFTVLEAMACGTPVVCSDAASLPEVAGDAALYADARNPNAFAAAMLQVFQNTEIRRTLIERGQRNLRRFSWSQAANSCLEIYAQAAGENSRQPVMAD